MGQQVLQHDWQWAPQPARLPWGYLARTGPNEETYVPGDGTIDGDGYECALCGCCRLFAVMDFVGDDGRPHRQSVAFHGLDWNALAPMNAPSCEVWERPALADAAPMGAAA